MAWAREQAQAQVLALAVVAREPAERQAAVVPGRGPARAQVLARERAALAWVLPAAPAARAWEAVAAVRRRGRSRK